MKLLNARQIKDWDKFTIQNEPVSSLDLMERAALAFTNWFVEQLGDIDLDVHILAGPGNNGGDALAIARLLSREGFDPIIWICKASKKTSEDFVENFNRLPPRSGIEIREISEGDPMPKDLDRGVIIDGLFGLGLNRPIENYWAEFINYINELDAVRFAIDIPSGLFPDRHSSGAIFKAHFTLTFETPKLAMLLPEGGEYCGDLHIQEIQLDYDFINLVQSNNHFVTAFEAIDIKKVRPKFGHKGTFGHAQLVMGSHGKIGAAILATKAAMRSGTGKVTTHLPGCGYTIMQVAFPEAMVSIDQHELQISQIPIPENISAVGIGCGMGTNAISLTALQEFLPSWKGPLVLDADALNMLALSPALFHDLPENTILTPHVKEFERMFGKSKDAFARLELQRKKSKEWKLFILLKGAYSCLTTPNGQAFFNSTGNSGMATAGSGDVLTGIITGLLAQGYETTEAAIYGMYLHGVAGDLARIGLQSEEALIASDLIENLGEAFRFNPMME